jgi:hypothetical protein
MTPLDKVEVLYRELVYSYGEGSDKEIRAASKLLMVALDEIKRHGGPQWREIVEEYMQILAENPQKYEKILATHRSQFEDEIMVVEVRK